MIWNKVLFNQKSLIFSLASLLLTTSLLHADDNPFDGKFPIKEGVVTYAVRGNHTGSKILYFSDYGKKQLIVEKKLGGFLQKPAASEKIILIKSDEKYVVDMREDRATKSTTLRKKLYDRFQSLTKKEKENILENIQHAKPRSYRNIDGVCTPAAKEILGYPVTREEIDGMTQYSLANGTLVLETSVHLLGYDVDTFATSIQARKVDPKIFELPKGVKIVPQNEKNLERKAKKILHAWLTRKLTCQDRPQTTSENTRRIMFEEIKNLSEKF